MIRPPVSKDTWEPKTECILVHLQVERNICVSKKAAGQNCCQQERGRQSDPGSSVDR